MKKPSAGGPRRLIAGLRITRHDEDLLEAVRPLFPEATSEGEVAYRLWRRGLELTLAEFVSLGAPPPPGESERLLANLVARRLLLCLPLLRRTGTLSLLGLETPYPATVTSVSAPPNEPSATAAIDTSAADAITALGGSDFL